MKEPLIIFVKVAQALPGFLLLLASGYSIFIALLAAFDQAIPLWSEGPRALLLGSGVPGTPGLLTVIAAYGLLLSLPRVRKLYWRAKSSQRAEMI